MNDRIKTIKILTTALIIFIVLLFTAMLINFVSLARVNSRKNELELLLADRQTQIEVNAADIAYKENEEYIERYARELLNMKRKGEDTVIGKEND